MTGASGKRQPRPRVDIPAPIDLKVQTAAMRALNGVCRQQGMTALDLALASGILESTFSDLIAGRRAASLRQAVQLADAAGLRVVMVPKDQSDEEEWLAVGKNPLSIRTVRWKRCGPLRQSASTSDCPSTTRGL